MTRKHQSFTLIEILVVVFIIALLAAAIIVSFSYSRQKSRDTTRLTDLNKVAAALQNYYLDHGQYPAFNALDPGQIETDLTISKQNYLSLLGVLSPSYFDTCPRDPTDRRSGCLDPQNPSKANFGYRYVCWRSSPTATDCQSYLLLGATEIDANANVLPEGASGEPEFAICNGKTTGATTCAVEIANNQSHLDCLSNVCVSVPVAGNNDPGCSNVGETCGLPPPPPPTVDIKANGDDGPITIDYNTAATLSWTSTNATSCAASGDWSGGKNTSGSESTGNLTALKTYIITCQGDGSAEDSVAVNVRAVTHNVCNFTAKTCEQIPGAGTNECTSFTDCQHKECDTANQTCVLKDGIGNNLCNSNADCQPPPTHNVCNFTARTCEQVSGAGTNECTSFTNCQHKECDTPTKTCVLKDGAGANLCNSDADCQPVPSPTPTHGSEEIVVTLWRNLTRTGVGSLSISIGPAGYQVNGQNYSETWQVTAWADLATGDGSYSSGGFLGIFSNNSTHQLGLTGLYGAFFNDIVDTSYHPTAVSLPTQWHGYGTF